MSAEQPTKCQIADVLDKSADIILERGWAQGNFETEQGSVCALGAVRRATGYQIESWYKDGSKKTSDVPWSSPEWLLRQSTMEVLEKEIRETTSFEGITRWNDYRGRTTPTKILSTFRALAARLRSEGDCG